MKEHIEKLHDEALLAQFNIDKQLKITVSLTMVIQRQLTLLAEKTGTAVEDMDREFILANLANVDVTEQASQHAAAVVERVLKK